MIDKEQVRFKLHVYSESVENTSKWSEELSKLTLYDCDGKLTMSAFYESLHRIVSWYEIQQFQQVNEDVFEANGFDKVIAVLAWCKKTWFQSASEGNLEQSAICYIIAKRLYLVPQEDFDWRFDQTKMIESLNRLVPSIKFDVSDQLPESVDYSQKKFHSDYQKALKENDYKGIFIFLNAIERGCGFQSEGSEFLEVLIRICSNVDISIISKSLGNYSPYLLSLLVRVLDLDENVKMLELYNSLTVLPLLVGLKRVIDPRNENANQELKTDWAFIGKCSMIIESISNRVNEPSLARYLHNTLGRINSTIWHNAFTAFAVKNPNYIPDYASYIDFSFDQNGEYSYRTCLQFGIDNTVNRISKCIYQEYFTYIESSDTKVYTVVFSKYYDYIIHNITLIVNNDCHRYVLELENISNALLRNLYSWDIENRGYYFTKLVFWILAAKWLECFSGIQIDELPNTRRVLSDRKIIGLIQERRGDTEIRFDELNTLLESPSNVKSIILPYKNEAIKVLLM